MADALDLYRSAWLLVKDLGTKDALATAKRKEEERLEAGDVIGAAAWRAIRSAIEELGRTDPEGISIH